MPDKVRERYSDGGGYTTTLDGVPITTEVSVIRPKGLKNESADEGPLRLKVKTIYWGALTLADEIEVVLDRDAVEALKNALEDPEDEEEED